SNFCPPYPDKPQAQYAAAILPFAPFTESLFAPFGVISSSNNAAIPGNLFRFRTLSSMPNHVKEKNMVVGDAIFIEFS
ncbi:MAG TPA: hypothetical protein VHY22_00720, partial [Chthoniobacteraceae bacterium]|nr:hypothetical protein [Chthoniobacteraceae bacterium]